MKERTLTIKEKSVNGLSVIGEKVSRRLKRARVHGLRLPRVRAVELPKGRSLDVAVERARARAVELRRGRSWSVAGWEQTTA